MKELDSYCGTIDHNTIYAYVKDYHTCSGIFTQPVNAGMDITYFTLGRIEKMAFMTSISIFLKNIPAYLLMQELDS